LRRDADRIAVVYRRRALGYIAMRLASTSSTRSPPFCAAAISRWPFSLPHFLLPRFLLRLASPS